MQMGDADDFPNDTKGNDETSASQGVDHIYLRLPANVGVVLQRSNRPTEAIVPVDPSDNPILFLDARCWR
jgi:hypothetical protein